MPSIYQLKPAFQNLLRPLCGGLARAGVTANQVTIAAAAGSVILGLLLALYPSEVILLAAVPIYLFIRMALNAIDGMLAREFDMQSRLGAVLNELGDVVSDAALYLPFALHPALPAWPVVLIVLMAVVNEMAGVVAVQIGASRRYDGPFGKSDRAFGFGLLALLLLLPWQWDYLYEGLLGLMLILSLVTLVNRCRMALREAI